MKHKDRKAARIELAREARALIASGMKPDAAAVVIGATRTLMFKALRELREAEAHPIDPLLQ